MGYLGVPESRRREWSISAGPALGARFFVLGFYSVKPPDPMGRLNKSARFSELSVIPVETGIFWLVSECNRNVILRYFCNCRVSRN